MLKYLFLFMIWSGSAVAEDCFNQYQKEFANKTIWFIYNSKTPQSLNLSMNNYTKKDCKTSYRQIKNYVATTFPKTSLNSNSYISWNSFVVSGKPVYDYIAVINPINNDKVTTPEDNYTLSQSATYQAISMFNDVYGCYFAHLQSYRTSSSYPNDYQELKCKQAGTNNNLKLLDLVTEKDLVKKLLTTDYFKNVLKQAKVKAVAVNTLTGLTNAMANYNNDEWQCVSGDLTPDFDSFAVTLLNPDGTINLKLALTSDIHACSSVFKTVEIYNLKPKLSITSFRRID